MRSIFTMVAAVGFVLGAAPAFAGECAGGVCSLPVPSSAVERALDAQAAPSARDIQTSVDSYLASAKSDTSLVGGCGSAGYDGGFWIRGGTFLLKINLTIQTRWEGFQWNDEPASPSPGGDLSGFSLPRVTLKLSGDATCDVRYYAELEFGHSGSSLDNSVGRNLSYGGLFFRFLNPTAPANAVPDLGVAREAWIEYEAAPQLAFRMGLIKTAATRQLMTPPEMQQFVDISMASSYIGQSNPGYTDRNRDYGFMIHGGLGCDGAWQYMLTVTNGDGPVHRNVLDGTTDDPMAYGARVNWDVLGHMGYEEGALRQRSCDWTASIGVWGTYFIDHRTENPLTQLAERTSYGVDLAAGYGGFSFTGAYNMVTFTDKNGAGFEFDGTSYLGQLGYLFPDTAWEIAARYSSYVQKPRGNLDTGGTEYGFAVNYYIDGHADKITADVAFITADKNGNHLADTYAAYDVTSTSDASLLRLQWQLAL